MNLVISLVLLIWLGASGCTVKRGFERGYTDADRASNEQLLKLQLAMMRESIQRFTVEQGKPPQSFDELLYTHYLTVLPVDPMTNKSDWVLVYHDCSRSADCKNGIKDVHSASAERSSIGTTYLTW